MTYRNAVLGNQGTKCIPVKKLPDEVLTKKNKTFVIAAEIAQHEKALKDLRSSLEEMQKACPHHYFNDTAGFPYDVRCCDVCGKYMGMI